MRVEIGDSVDERGDNLLLRVLPYVRCADGADRPVFILSLRDQRAYADD